MITWQLGIALYGAVLSSVLAFWQWRKSRRTVRITAIPALNDSPDREGFWVRVAIQNRGYEPFHVASASMMVRLERPDLGLFGIWGLVKYQQWHRSWWYMQGALPLDTQCEPDLPHTVEPGRSTIFWLPADALKDLQSEAVRGELRFQIRDELDRAFLSARLPSWT